MVVAIIVAKASAVMRIYFVPNPGSMDEATRRGVAPRSLRQPRVTLPRPPCCEPSHMCCGNTAGLRNRTGANRAAVCASFAEHDICDLGNDAGGNDGALHPSLSAEGGEKEEEERTQEKEEGNEEKGEEKEKVKEEENDEEKEDEGNEIQGGSLYAHAKLAAVSLVSAYELAIEPPTRPLSASPSFAGS